LLNLSNTKYAAVNRRREQSLPIEAMATAVDMGIFV